MPTLNENQRIFVLDSQKLDSIQSCHFHYRLKHEEHYRRNDVPIYLERGSLIHHMIAVYYSCKMEPNPLYDKSHSEIVQYAVDAGRELALEMKSLDISELERTIEVFLEYTDFWENDGLVPTFVEKVGTTILHESPELIIAYEVKIDLGIQCGKSIIPVDHKHAQQRRDPNDMSNQFIGYCFYLGSNNIIINEIGFQKTLKASEKFRRHTLSYSDSQIQEWKQDTIDSVLNYIGLAEQGRYIKNRTSCDKYSGCEFREVCRRDPSIRDVKLNELYHVDEVWDVGSKLGAN